MSVRASPLPPPDAPPEITDFLRRLASMMTGGRNAEMLLQAADRIEAVTRRATAAEELYQQQTDDHAKNREQREIAELAADNLMAEVASLKAELEESKQQAERDRNFFEEEVRRLRAEAEDAQSRAATLTAELQELRTAAETIDETIAVVPIQSLLLARAQFDYLADGFARDGDVISQTICEIGACAIAKALGASTGETNGASN